MVWTRRYALLSVGVVFSLSLAGWHGMAARPLGAPPDASLWTGSTASELRDGAADEPIVVSATVLTAPPIVVPRAPRAVVRTTTPALAETDNYLLVGLDQRIRGRGWGRADTIMLVVFDARSGHVGLVSVPRDLRVYVPQHGMARINAVLRIAKQTGQAPIPLLEQVVEETLQAPIRASVVIDLDAFERMVDALGGVRVTVVCPIDDNFIDSREATGRRALHVTAGVHLMDGATAAMYVRSRHGRSDWSRARRQQAVVIGIRDRVLSSSVVARLPALWSELRASVVTELRMGELLRLAARAADIELQHVHGLVLGYREAKPTRALDNRSVLVPDYEAIDRALGRLFDAPAPGKRRGKAGCPASDVALTGGSRSKSPGARAAGMASQKL